MTIKQLAELTSIIHELDDKLQKKAIKHILPLCEKGLYDEAKKELRVFYKDAFDKNGDCTLFSMDMVNYYINVHRKKYSKG